MTRFLHTADWQIGKPFARVADTARTLLRQERIATVERIGVLAREQGAQFVLVAGDLFDTGSPNNETVSAMCRAVGTIGVPVLAIPGNHDHGGPGSIWSQAFFLREQQSLAPNFRLLNQAKPEEVAGSIILPCPLTRRQELADVTTWLQHQEALEGLSTDRPWIVLAHGSVQGFSSADDGEESSAQSNAIDLERLAPGAFDYIALGDWHGTKQVGERAWYSGTPELDRFAKGESNDPGNVLCVEIAGRRALPKVTSFRTAKFGWHEETFQLMGDDSLVHLEARLASVVGDRTQHDLLKLSLTGQLGFDADRKLDEIVERLQARLLRLKLDRRVQVIPADDEIAKLTGRAGDPLISAVANRLAVEQQAGGPAADKARRALRELYAVVEQGGVNA